MQLLNLKNSKVVVIDYSHYLQPSSVKAYFTTRKGGISKGEYGDLNLGRVAPDNPQSVNENYRLLFSALPNKKRHLYCKQVHGCDIYIDDGHANGEVGAFDGLISNHEDVFLTTYHADCYPIYASVKGCNWFGVAHSGWRGTYGEIATVLVRSLLEHSQASSADINVVIGPGIGVNNYEVDAKLYTQFKDKFGEEGVGQFGESHQLNLKQCIIQSLLKQGILSKNIYVEKEDTFDLETLLFSYRRQGAQSGRMITIVYQDK